MQGPTTETGGEAGTSISIITRTLGSPLLADALESLTRQTRTDFELVLVDMSRGGAESVLARFSDRLPAVRRLAIGKPMSRPMAVNAGIAAARTGRIGILDEDNVYDPSHLERLIEGLEESGADYVYTGVRHATFSTDGCRIESRDVSIPFRFEKVILGNYIYATGSAFRRSLWERVGGYDERFEVFEDWDFIIRAAQQGRFHHLPIVSGESRKFTSMTGASTFDLEYRSVRRCMAGLYWKHRHLFRGERRRELQLAAAEHCRRRVPARQGFLTRTAGGWRLELGLDLVSWWLTRAPGRAQGSVA